MTERTVTEQQVIDAMNKHSVPSSVYSELFPDLPKVGELIKVCDEYQKAGGEWFPFVKINDDGYIIVIDIDGEEELWDNYRRQTPVERGEG
jgi:hypothetical protein